MKSAVGDRVEPNGFGGPQLVINELVLPPGGEWSPELPGWMIIHVASGVGYWLYPSLNWELRPGAVVLFSEQVHGCVRASQVGELRLHYFRTEPGKLTGLVSLAEQALMQNAAGDEKLWLRLVPPNPQFSDKVRSLSSERVRNTFPARVQLLQLFLEAFGGTFRPPPPEVAGGFDARERLRQMLSQTPVAELLQISFAELVGRTRCSARHVSRLFTELVGVSFREKQAELRLARACDLLATTDSKLMEVAQESGYQSTSLFSVMFKQRYGISPAKWREQTKGNGRRGAKLGFRRLRIAA